jgi:hypothetical protein
VCIVFNSYEWLLIVTVAVYSHTHLCVHYITVADDTLHTTAVMIRLRGCLLVHSIDIE